MAMIKSGFECMVCKQPMAAPENTQILDFICLFIQFYRQHDFCEQNQKTLASQEAKLKEAIQKTKVKKGKKK